MERWKKKGRSFYATSSDGKYEFYQCFLRRRKRKCIPFKTIILKRNLDGVTQFFHIYK